MKWKHVMLTLLVLISSLVTVGNIYAEEKMNIGIELGNEAPDFNITTLDGESVALSDYRGKPVMLNFWATWCPPCRQEMPDMEKFYKEKEVEILAINLSDTEINQDKVQSFVDELGFSFDIGLDEDGAVALQYRINPIPTTFMIDSEGIVRHKAFGAMNYETMVEHLENMN